jgi:small basic protein
MADRRPADSGVLSGYPKRVFETHLSKGELRLYIAVITQVILTVLLLAMSLGLVSTQPSPDSVSSRISFAVFVTVFSLVGCVYIFFLSPRIEDEGLRKGSCAIVGFLGFIFYIAGTLALTVGIAPGGSCSDDSFTMNNGLIDGVPSRCRLLQADIVIFWLGMFLHE